MNRKIGNLKLLVGGSILVFAGVAWATRYQASEFSGGQGIHDSGLFSYPRFHVQLGNISASDRGEHQFTVKGLPPDKLSLRLQVVDSGTVRPSQLSLLSTNIAVRVSDSLGHLLCVAEGPLFNANSGGEGGWILSSSVSQMSFWHPSCQDISVKRSTPYTIKISVSEPDPKSPQLTLTAILEGGGIELP